MDARKKRRLRILGKILFVLYILFVFYFLIFSDWYGRTGEMQEYHYNLVLFKEIKRFWNYRGQLGAFATFTNLFGNYEDNVDPLNWVVHRPAEFQLDSNTLVELPRKGLLTLINFMLS